MLKYLPLDILPFPTAVAEKLDVFVVTVMRISCQPCLVEDQSGGG
jgi:hypothetical protein